MEVELTEAGRNRLQGIPHKVDGISTTKKEGIIMNKSKKFDWILIFVIGTGLIILLLIILVLQGKISPDGFVVGTGTFLLAIATFYLAYTERTESISNRIQDKELAEKDRRRLRLKEQLEGLYSPLMSCLNYLDNRDAHTSEPLLSLMQKLRGKFEFLAENDLRDLLREYYVTDIPVISKTDWDNLIYPMIEAIGTGCADISFEYDDLTRKAT